MGEKVVVDTYALLSMAFGELGKNAEEYMIKIREGKVEGIITTTVVFEFTLHWLRGKIPSLSSIDEVKTFLSSYFKVNELSTEDFIESAKIKIQGDKILSEELKGRKLSIVDSSLIYLAKKLGVDIISGDKDLVLVANKMNIKVIW